MEQYEKGRANRDNPMIRATCLALSGSITTIGVPCRFVSASSCFLVIDQANTGRDPSSIVTLLCAKYSLVSAVIIFSR